MVPLRFVQALPLLWLAISVLLVTVLFLKLLGIGVGRFVVGALTVIGGFIAAPFRLLANAAARTTVPRPNSGKDQHPLSRQLFLGVDLAMVLISVVIVAGSCVTAASAFFPDWDDWVAANRARDAARVARAELQSQKPRFAATLESWNDSVALRTAWMAQRKREFLAADSAFSAFESSLGGLSEGLRAEITGILDGLGSPADYVAVATASAEARRRLAELGSLLATDAAFALQIGLSREVVSAASASIDQWEVLQLAGLDIDAFTAVPVPADSVVHGLRQARDSLNTLEVRVRNAEAAHALLRERVVWDPVTAGVILLEGALLIIVGVWVLGLVVEVTRLSLDVADHVAVVRRAVDSGWPAQREPRGPGHGV